MEKTTKQSRFKIRWLNTPTLILMVLGLFLPVLQANAQVSYCTATNLGGSGSLLANVTFGSINNTTGAATSPSYYSYWPAQTTNVMMGSTVNLSVTIDPAGTSYSGAIVSVWFDWNQDGTLSATEWTQVGTNISSGTTATVAIAIPVTATQGTTRMRVRSRGAGNANGSGDACTSLGSGDTEDYDITVVPATPCSGTPTAGTASATTRACNSQPFTLSVTGTTIAGNMTYEWESSPAGAGTWTTLGTGMSYVVTNQTVNTDYRFVATCTTSSSSATSNTVTVNQLAAATVFYENFDSTATGSTTNNTVPDCWTYLNKASSGYGYTTTTAGRTGKGFRTYRPSTTGEMLLISPQTNNLGSGTKQVRFWAKVSSTTYETTQKLGVYTMSDPTSTGVLSLVENNIPLTTTWQEFIVPLPVTTDDYFAFSFDSQNGTAYVYLDDVYYEDLSPCVFPINLQATNITATTATISWNASLATGVTGYEYEVRTSGAPGSGATGLEKTGIVMAPNTSAPLTGLSGATTYTVYIRSICGSSNGAWTTFPIKFNTLCEVVTASFYENFDGVTTGAYNNPTVPICWTYLNKASSGYGYTTTSAGRTGKGFYTYRPNTTGEMLLISPETNNLGNGTKQVRFWARVSSTSYETTQKLGVYTMDDPTATGVLTLVQTNIPLTTTWQEFIIPLPASTDDYFAFSFDSQNGTAYVYLDDVYYEDLSACVFPMNLQVTNVTQSTATISWDASLAAGVTAYEYEIRTSGAAGSGATGLEQTGIVNAPATSVNISNLPHSTAYTVYIRSVCGTNNGIWTSFPVTFNTLCGVITGNFFEGFENADTGSSNNNTVPTCWTYLKSGTNATYPYGYVATTGPKTGSKHFYTYQSSSYDGEVTLVSPETNNLGNGTKRLRFSARLYFTGNYGEKLSVYRMNGNTASATKTLLKTVNVSSTAYTEYIVYLPVSTTDDYFAFGIDNEGMSKYIFIDDIYYEDAPTCRPIEESTIQISNVSKSQFTVTWQDLYNVTPPAYQVEVRETGAPGTPGAAYTTITAPGVMTADVLGLNPDTKYTVYVRAYCSGIDQSDWAKGGEVTTLCAYSDFASYTQSLALCGPQKAVLDAVLVDTTYEAAWFDSPTDPDPLAVGSNFVSPNDVTADRSFWLRSQKIVPNSDAQVGNGTSTTDNDGNFNQGYYEGYKHQYIFTADELAAAGLTAGPISALKYDVVAVGGINPKLDFSIAIGTTTQASATTNFIDNNLLTQVYSSASESFATGLKTFTFTTPYIWDGTSNLVIQVISNSGDWDSNRGILKSHTTPVNKTTYRRSDNQTTSYFVSVATGTSINGRPNTIFVGNVGCVSPMIEIPVTVAPKPAFELSTDKLVSCEGANSAPVTIITNLGGYDTFVWTPSTGVSGDEINGWTFSSTQDQDYVLSASQSNGICEHIKTVRVMASKSPEPLTTLASNYDLCKGDVQELKALEPIPSSATIGLPVATKPATSPISAFIQSDVYSKQQYIYSAAEIQAQGLNTMGYITQLSFETINSGAALTNAQYTVKMMMVPNTTFGSTSFETGNLSMVFTASNYAHTFQGVQTILLDSPFYWDGQSNILVEITQEGAGSGNNAQTYFNTVTGNNVGMYATSATDPDPLVGTRTNDRLNVVFSFEQSTVTWSPTNNLYLDAATTIPYTTGTNALKVYTVSTVGVTQVYNADLTAPSGCMSTKTVTVNVADAVAPTVQNQTFCQPTPVSSVVVSGGTSSTTYNFYNSATATTPITTISSTGTYYVEGVQGSCRSARVAFAVTITALSAPNAQLTQTSCGNGTVANLQATGVAGAQINWYASVTSTTPLPATQALVNNTVYYASQVFGGCESTRIAVLVKIGSGPASLTPQTISICGALNYGTVNLNQLAGAELVWYQSATSQQPIPNTSQVVTGTYYVSQKINGCESLRAQIIVTAQGGVSAPVAIPQNICGNGTVAQLSVQTLPNATAEWYSSATSTTPLVSTTPLTSGTYYVAQRIGNCVSTKVPVSVKVISTSAPSVAPISLCEGAKVEDLSLPTPTGVSYNWYLNGTSTTVLPATDILQSGYYFVAKLENGCESARTQVQITINSRPSSPTGASPQIFTNYAEISNLIMNEPNVVWYATYEDAMNGVNPLQQNMPMVNGSTYYAVVIGTNGCPSLPTPVEVEIVLGVNDFDLSKLNYYPNPTSDLLTIDYSEVITKVEVFDLNGRLVMTRDFESETVQLDFGTLSSGTYMLNVKTKDSSQFVKIVKK